MFNVIIVDDEKLALMHLKKLLTTKFDDINVIGTYTNPKKFIDELPSHEPDLIFIDIHMPEVNGLELATIIQEQVPSVEIAFISGYDTYALQAFELLALDYVMKPVQLSRLQKTIYRLHKNRKIGKINHTLPAKLEISCFDYIKIKRANIYESIKWRTSKAQELFAYLLHNRRKSIDVYTLIEMLWPDFETERALQQLYTTIYHIRNTLKKMNLLGITISRSTQPFKGYRLDIDDSLTIDVEEWEQGLTEIDTPNTYNHHLHKDLHEAYTGDYLGELGYLWAEAEKERLKNLWITHTDSLCDYYVQHKNYLLAIAIQENVQKKYPLDEESYFTLMKLYNFCENHRAVKEQYTLLLQTFERELNTKPSDYIIRWMKTWENNPSLLLEDSAISKTKT